MKGGGRLAVERRLFLEVLLTMHHFAASQELLPLARRLAVAAGGRVVLAQGTLPFRRY